VKSVITRELRFDHHEALLWRFTLVARFLTAAIHRISAITSDHKVFFLTDQRLAARLMIGNVCGDRFYAFAVELSDLLLPISAAVFGPLKRKLDDVPWLAEMGSGFQRGS